MLLLRNLGVKQSFGLKWLINGYVIKYWLHFKLCLDKMIKKHPLNVVEMIIWTDTDPYKSNVFKSYVCVFGLGNF